MTKKTTPAAPAASLEAQATAMGVSTTTLEYLIARGDVTADEPVAQPVEEDDSGGE